MFDAEASEDGAENSDEPLESEDESSVKAEFEYEDGSKREQNAGSGEDVDALDGKNNAYYGEDVNAFKGEDYDNSESEFDTSNVSSYIISRHDSIWEYFIQVDNFLNKEENKVSCVQIYVHSDWI